jgi:LruC domain-containing protein
MKKVFLIIGIISAIIINTNAQTLLPTLTAESGNRTVEQTNCWGFGATTYSNLEFRINGFWSMRSNALTSSDLTACWIKSPWIKPNSGNITMKVRLESDRGTSRGMVFQYIPYNADAASISKEGTATSFYTYNWATPLDILVKDISVPVPAAIANSGQPYKILISYIGSGGTSRAFSDDLYIPGTYWSDPSNSCLPLPTVVDKDKDGVADGDDAYPEDADRAYNTDLVNEATLMFEDLWPSAGDYDFNDLVTKYNAIAVTNADNNVVEVLLNTELRAVGASFNNGFLMQFDNLDPKRITKVEGNILTKTKWLNFSENGTENDQKYANVLIFSEAKAALPNPGGSGVNVNPDAPYVDPETIKMVISFDVNKGNTTTVKELALNPYIIVNQVREVEVHLADYMPTSKASEKLFGTGGDVTNVEKGKTYRTANNLPFAIQIDKTAPHMIEKQDILKGYLNFAEWAKSNGELYKDWYSNTDKEYRNDKLLYYMKGDK